MRILHLARIEAFEDARSGPSYAPAAFPQDGFVHCCTPEQLAGVLERWFADATTLILLDLSVAEHPALRWEAAPNGERFPHLYHPIAFDWIVAQHRIVRSETGWRLPTELFT